MGIGIFILLYTEPLAFVRIQRTMSKTEKVSILIGTFCIY